MSPRHAFVSPVVALGLVLGLLFAAARPAHASDPNRVFAGQIITMKKRPPSTAKSPNAYIAVMRKMKQTAFWEDKTDHTWMIYFAAFLKVPLNDVEYAVKLYEVSGSSQKLLASIDQFTDTRGEKTILSKVKLDKDTVGVNKYVLMTLENKGKILASTHFKLLGEGDHYNGKVNFSQDEANGKDDDDDAKK